VSSGEGFKCRGSSVPYVRSRFEGIGLKFRISLGFRVKGLGYRV